MSENFTQSQLYEDCDIEAKKWIDNQDIRIKEKINHWTFSISISLLFPFIISFFKPESTDSAIWFQRSGAFILVFSLLAEIKCLAIDDLVNKQTQNTFLYCNNYIKNKYKTFVIYINYLNYFVIAVGTIVCGYGDMIYMYLSS